MTDIKEQPWYHHLGPNERAEVERMAAEIERLREALQEIADDGRNCADHCRRQARRALEPKP
jgi:hypothetical protein